MTRILSALLAAHPSHRVLAQDPPKVDPFDQSKVPLEVEPPADFKGKRVLIVAGRQSHGPGDHEFFAGTAILMNLLKQNRRRLPDHGPRRLAEEREALRHGRLHRDVHGRRRRPPGDQARADEADPEADSTAGAGWVNIHYAVEYPVKQATATSPGRSRAGWAATTRRGYSINPHWDAEIRSLPKHPITRGVKPFTLRDEWYYGMRWIDDMKGVTPILQAVPPDDTRRTEHTKVAQGRDRDDGVGLRAARTAAAAFGFTGGHFHRNWADENFRRVVVNAILWCAKVEVPESGAKVDVRPGRPEQEPRPEGEGRVQADPAADGEEVSSTILTEIKGAKVPTIQGVTGSAPKVVKESMPPRSGDGRFSRSHGARIARPSAATVKMSG